MTGWLIATELFGEHGSGQKEILFCFLDLTLLSTCIILSFCNSMIDYKRTHLALVQYLSQVSARKPYLKSTPRGGPNPQASQMTCPET